MSRSSRSRRSPATTSSIRSDATPWYQGPTLMAHLEEVFIASDSNQIDVRFPVQYVSRSHRPVEYRGYAGTVAGGVLRPGDEVMVLPGGQTSTIAGIDTGGEALDEAFPPMAVSVELTDEIDIGRGDMLCRPNNQPRHANEFDTMVCWMTEQRSLKRGDMVRVKHTTRWTRARRVGALPHRREHTAPRRRRRRARTQRDRSCFAEDAGPALHKNYLFAANTCSVSISSVQPNSGSMPSVSIACMRTVML